MKKFEISRYEVKMNKPMKEEASKTKEFCKKNPIRLVMLSDLHNNFYGVDLEQLLVSIENEQPDAVVIAGDMYLGDSRCDNRVADAFLSRLAAKFKLYYSMGNHEYRLMIYRDRYPGMYEQFERMIRKTGIHLLQNQTLLLEMQGRKIAIGGLMVDRSFYQKWKRTKMQKDYMQEKMGIINEEYYNILLAHHPDYFKEYAAWGADLVFSGHVHGGMARLPFVGGVIAPNYRLFPRYDKGLYREGKSTMILSSGIGTHTILLRPWNPPEMVVVTLY